MTRFYLYLNAAFYLAFAAWCTIAPVQTAHSVGYETLSAGGASEYLVIYGGMEFGFAVFFAYCAQRARQLGVVFALCLYGPAVVWRWPSVISHWPVSATTLATGILELVLFIAAVLLWRRRPKSIFR